MMKIITEMHHVHIEYLHFDYLKFILTLFLWVPYN
jgi:hypothetical protein